MAHESLPLKDAVGNPDNVIEPNGLPRWENDLLGTSEAQRSQSTGAPLTAANVMALQKYCYELLPNGKSGFENDMLGVPD